MFDFYEIGIKLMAFKLAIDTYYTILIKLKNNIKSQIDMALTREKKWEYENHLKLTIASTIHVSIFKFLYETVGTRSRQNYND